MHLRRQPVPEDWEAGRHPRPAELAAYLDEIVRDLRWGPRAGEHLALELDVGLPDPAPAPGGGDELDDYLFPVVRRLGPVRFDAVFATRRPPPGSCLRVAPATPDLGPTPPPQLRVRTTASATSIDWKQQLHDACREATGEPAPPGRVAVQIRFTVSRRRNWTVLWKPALDSLGPILGVPDRSRPYRADDRRVSALGLHRRFDDTLGHRVLVEVWWQPQRFGQRA